MTLMNKRHILYRCFVLLLKVLLGCLLGCSIVLYFASQSEVVHQEIHTTVQNMFKDSFDCEWDGELELIDLLALQIHFKRVTIAPCNRSDGWTLYTDKFQISASWFDIFLYQRIACHSYFEQVVVHEKQSDGSSHFAKFLSKMFSSALPTIITFNVITIKQGQMIVQDASGDMQGSYEYNCQVSQESDGVHTQLYLLDGQCSYKNRVIGNKFFGNINSVIPYENDLHKMYARVDCRLSIPELQDKGDCFVKGDLYNARGAFIVSNEDQSFIIEPLKFRLKKHAMPFTACVTMKSDVIQKLMMQDVAFPDLSGNMSINIQGNFSDLASSLQGNLQIYNVAYKNSTLVDKIVMSFDKEQDGYASKIFFNARCVLQGDFSPAVDGWKFDITNIVELVPWWTSYWKMPANKGSISGSITNSLILKGAYNFAMESAKLNEQAQVQGSFACDAEKWNFKGSFLDKQFESTFEINPTPHLAQLRYFSGNETFINFHEHQDPSQGTVGFVGFNFIKNLLPDQYKSSFSQPAKINMTGHLQQGVYFADAAVDDAHIRIPSLYNVIENFKAATQCDFMNRSIEIDNFIANLYEGKMRVDHAVGVLSAQGQLSFLHAPMFLDQVLISWTKGIFGVVSGRLFASLSNQQQLKLQGNFILDKTQLKGNIFSTEFQEQLLGKVSTEQPMEGDFDLDISVQTKDPISIETSFLQATAHLDFHITNSMKQPEVEGTINLVSGELKFPYKSLFITHGQVLILPKSSSEPTIEFVAKGKIKRYNITMRATGTMMDQQIHFESSPYLTEEQIISLLFVGSLDNSLSVIMPAMFMQKLHEIVFGPAMSKTKLDLLFNRLLQSFKNVRIFPQFTNQTGRGGVRGVVEVDATERLHGRIDSNLMQLEDTIFEADYALTDDVTVRAIKDGPSTYGGEVEMRWKFS